MKRLLLPLLAAISLPAALSLPDSVSAEETCMFVSQYEPDVTIELSTENSSFTRGLMKYKGSPLFRFETGLRNSYYEPGSQYYAVTTIPNTRKDKVEEVSWGEVVTIVGDQPSRKGTPKDKRKRGLIKLFFPRFSEGYYYYLANIEVKIKKEGRMFYTDGRFGGRTEKINTILNASEGFWFPSEICKKYVFYGW